MSSYRVTWHSLASFDSLRTIVVNYFVLPIISLVMFLLIAYNSTQDYRRILLGTIITAGISTGIGIISASTVYDQNIGMIDEVLSILPNLKKYWLPKFVIADGTLLIETIVLNTIGLASFHQFTLMPKFLISLVFVVIITNLLGYFCSIAGIKKNNPYWLTNFITAILVLVSGIIIPVNSYPIWLKIFADIFPISNLLDWIFNIDYVNLNLLLILVKLIFWFVLCIVLTKITKQLRLNK